MPRRRRPPDAKAWARVFATAFRHADLSETSEITKRVRAARNLPPGAEREAWSVIGTLTPREARTIWRYLRDPLARRRGRPRGAGPDVTELVGEIEERVEAGERPTTAAREALKARGVRVGLKSKADHLVRVLNRAK